MVEKVRVNNFWIYPPQHKINDLCNIFMGYPIDKNILVSHQYIGILPITIQTLSTPTHTAP